MYALWAFLNGASSAYYARYAEPLIDEDLAKTMDNAFIYMGNNPNADSEQAHDAGNAFIAALGAGQDKKAATLYTLLEAILGADKVTDVTSDHAATIDQDGRDDYVYIRINEKTLSIGADGSVKQLSDTIHIKE